MKFLPPTIAFTPPTTAFTPPTAQESPDRNNWLSLLSTCKQIYNETRLLPFALNSFLFSHKRHMCTSLDRLSDEQRSMITAIQVEVYIDPWRSRLWVGTLSWNEHAPLPRRLGELLPSVNSVEVVAFDYGDRGVRAIPAARGVQDALNNLETHLVSVHAWSGARITMPTTSRNVRPHCRLRFLLLAHCECLGCKMLILVVEIYNASIY